MQIHLHDDGFTLIEIFLSIALISIILFLLTALIPGYKSIIISGKKTEALYEAQEDISEEIAAACDSGELLNIHFETQSISIAGEYIQIDTFYETLDNSSENIQIKYFKPRIE